MQRDDVSATSTADTSSFIPSNQCVAWSVAKMPTENNNDGTFTIPEWLAIERGIV
jgi:hypothetical protein